MKSILNLIEKANTLMENRRYDEAEPLLLVAIKHDKKNPEGYYLLGDVYCKQGRFKESINMLNKANALLPNHVRILHLLGWALHMNNNFDEGRKYMTLALTKEPHDIQILCDLTVLEMRAENYLKAREYGRTALSLAPDDEMALEVNAVLDQTYELRSLIQQKN